MNYMKSLWVWVLLMVATQAGAVSITVNRPLIQPGIDSELIVYLNNQESNLTGYQMSLFLPEGITVKKDNDDDYEYTLSSRHKNDHTMTIRENSDGGLLIVCFSTSKKLIDGAEGELFRLPLSVDPGVSLPLQGSLKDIIFSDTETRTYAADDVQMSFINRDNVITFADPNVKAICVENWDTDGDGELLKEEAATVEDLGEAFRGNETITSFNELQYFTGLTEISSYTFYECKNLTSVTIPSGVTYIGRNAFSNCVKLASIIIPDNVTEIGYDAFMSCESLTSVVIPNGVTVINQTFPACFNLSSVVIPNGVTNITNHSFYWCALTSVTIPSSVTSIGVNAFGYCNNLTTVKVENATPVGIEESVFTNRTNATLFVPVGSKEAYVNANYWKEFKDIIEDRNIDFEDDAVKALCVANWDTNGDGEISVSEAMAVEDLGGVFAGNTTITSFKELSYFTGLLTIGVTVDNSLRDVPFWAHTSGWGLDAPKTTPATPQWVIGESVAQPYGDLSVANFADLSDYDKLTISFSEGMPRILFNRDVDEGQWNEDESQSHLIDNTKGGWSAKYFTTDKNTITVDLKQLVEDKGFAHLHAIKGANGGNVTIESMTLVSGNDLPEGDVTSDPAKGFYGCTALVSVTIPVNVRALGDNAFGGCNSLNSIIIPAGVKSLGNNTFDGCDDLNLVTVRWTKPVEITEQCFTNRANATLVVPAGCVAAYTAADYWKEFGSIEDDNNILFVDDKVRELCVAAWDTDGDGGLSMEEAAVVTDLGAVFNSSKITSFNELQYFAGLTAIDDEAFYNCTNLTSVIIPKSVTSITNNPFSGCGSLAYLTVESGNENYDSRENCNAIIRTADNTLITGCLNTVIPNSVTSIGSDAFSECNGLTSVSIPSSVTAIGDEAFYGSGNLTTVVVENPTPMTIGSSTFSNRTEATLIVPDGSKEAYKAAEYWEEFKSIVETDEVVITELVTNGDLEGSDVSCFFSKVRNGDKEPATIVEGTGVNNSRSIVITSTAGGADAWDTQFYIRLNKSLPAGKEFTISFDYKASAAVSINSQSHNEPQQYIQWGVIGTPSCSTEWKHFSKTVVVPAECDGSDNDSGFKNDFRTISFDLGTDNTQDITFYFDNISVKVMSIAAGTAEKPSVATSAIKNPNFDNASNAGWSGTAPSMVGDGKHGPANAAEHYDKTFNTYQDVEGLPNGVYLLGVNSFFRGTWDDYKEGTNLDAYPALYAKVGEDSTSVRFNNAWSAMNVKPMAGDTYFGTKSYEASQSYEGITYYIPNDPSAFRQYEEEGFYKTAVVVEVTDGKMRIGVAKNAKSKDKDGNDSRSDWAIFDTFSLMHYGNTAASFQAAFKGYMEAKYSLVVNSTVTTSCVEAYNAAVAAAIAAKTVTSQAETVAAMAEAQPAIADAAEVVYKNVRLWKQWETLFNDAQTHKGKGIAELDKYLDDDAPGIKEALALTNEELATDIAKLQAWIEEGNMMVEPGTDVTNMYLKNADCESTEGWLGNPVPGTGGGNTCFEKYAVHNFDVYQIVTKAPKGVYSIEVQGFYRRMRPESGSYTLYVNGGQTPCGYVYMNNNQTALKCVYDDPSETKYSGYIDTQKNAADVELYYPNDMTSAAEAFAAQKYKSKAYGLVLNVGDELRIGVKGDENGADWAIWDNFKLVYEGYTADVVKPVLDEEIAAAEEKAKEAMDKDMKEALTAAIADAKTATAGTDGEAMFNALATLSAIDPDASIERFKNLIARNGELATATASAGCSVSTRQEASDLNTEITTGIANGIYTDADVDGLLEQIATMMNKLRIPDGMDQATDDNPKNATAIIVNPSYDEANNEGWTLTDGVSPGFGSGLIEVYNKNFDEYQDLENLPEGTYEVRVQGFYRFGDGVRDDSTYVKAPKENNNLLLYVTVGEDTIYVPMPRLAQDGKEEHTSLLPSADGKTFVAGDDLGEGDSWQWMWLGEPVADADNTFATGYRLANGMVPVSILFERGKFASKRIIFKVGAEGKARIGLKKEVQEDDNWCAWDNWTLTYYGPNSTKEIGVADDVLLGDVDGDGEITAQDASLVLQLVSGKISPDTEGLIYGAADVDGDDEVTAQDASLILQHVAGKITIGN